MTFDPSIRPRDHFAPQRGWLNDPNGLIVHDGEHHLFFQHTPDALVPGPMSWGHAVSPDLITWTELPTALHGTAEEHVWSGSVVHDASNSSGLAAGDVGPLVALWTRFDPATGIQTQCLSHSVDRGRTWTAYAGNPVLDIGSTAFRDPKVFRHGDGWAMVLVLAEDRTVELYRSADLLSWEHASSFGPEGFTEGIWECPDLVAVPVEGTSETAHVLLVSVQEGGPGGGSGMQYFVGELDEREFTATQPAQWVDHGADFYAAISYADSPGPEPVVQAWMSNWTYADRVPATGFRGSMSVPRRLSLRRRDDRLVLVQRPVVREGEPVLDLPGQDLTGTITLPVELRSGRVVLEVDLGTARRVGLHVRAAGHERTTVWIDAGSGTVGLDRAASGDDVHPAFAAVHTAPLPGWPGAVRLEVVVDVASVEVFVGDGELTLTDQVFPDPASTGVALVAEGGTARLRHLDVRA